MLPPRSVRPRRFLSPPSTITQTDLSIELCPVTGHLFRRDPKTGRVAGLDTAKAGAGHDICDTERAGPSRQAPGRKRAHPDPRGGAPNAPGGRDIEDYPLHHPRGGKVSKNQDGQTPGELLEGVGCWAAAGNAGHRAGEGVPEGPDIIYIGHRAGDDGDKTKMKTA